MSRCKIICKLYLKGVLITETVSYHSQMPPMGFALLINAFLDLSHRGHEPAGVVMYTKDCKIQVKVYEIEGDKSRLCLKKTFKSYTDYGYVEQITFLLRIAIHTTRKGV